MREKCPADLTAFLDSWRVDPLGVKPAVEKYIGDLLAVPDVRLDFKSRPGISYSVRAVNPRQQEREFFVLIDIVDDEPDERWLSVCFYADTVSDPRELGDIVPDGLDGNDACCFNLDEDDAKMRGYIGERILEAARNTSN